MAAPDMILETSIQMVDNPIMSPTADDIVPKAPAAGESLAVLLARSQDGDTGAMETIYHKFKGAFFSLAFRYGGDRATAEDLLQEIFIKIFTHLDDVRGAALFPGWAYRIALNTCYSHLREKKGKGQKTVSLDDVGDMASAAPGENAGSDLRRPLEDAIARLPGRLKEIFLLHDVQGFKHEEIAAMLRLTVGTSKSQLFKARLKIRDYLKTRNIGPGEKS
jgi:RNA polymerase sigma-70 factor (ECF subfamily)